MFPEPHVIMFFIDIFNLMTYIEKSGFTIKNYKIRRINDRDFMFFANEVEIQADPCIF
jgi:hypothetical protein